MSRPSMARPRHLDFSTGAGAGAGRRAGVVFRDQVLEPEGGGGGGGEVVIVARDTRALSLALRRLHCCSRCWPGGAGAGGGAGCSCSREAATASTVSVISESCSKCRHSKVTLPSVILRLLPVMTHSNHSSHQQ